MQQIADWLKQLGMSEYAERFAENRIDFSVLPDLTDQDLEKLGANSSVAQPLKIMKTRACVIEILSCILETRAPSLKSVSH